MTDNIVVKICGTEEQQYREIVAQIEADIAAMVNHDSHFAIVGLPSPKRRRAIPARQSRAASCYTTLVLPRLTAISAPCTSAGRVQKRRGRVKGVVAGCEWRRHASGHGQ
jgi:hypothetical protein